jgi:4-hydroxyphenylpyruvate dioxygenase-like putative hemolysin
MERQVSACEEGSRVMKLKAKRINHITVAVPAGEHAKARDFYGGVLGLEEVPVLRL